MIKYFPKPYEPFGWDINVKVDLPNYALKADLKNTTGIDTSKLAPKSYLIGWKAKVDILDIDKLIPVPVDSKELSDAVKNEVAKKTVDD